MENSNFTFMKSGLDNLESKPKMDNLETSQVLAVMTIFMENAVKIAEKITINENRKIISDKDIILSLKSQALDNYTIWNDDETKRDLIEISQNIYQDIVESQSHEEGDSDNMITDSDDDINDSNKEDNDDTNIENKKIETIKNSITQDFIEKLKTVEERWTNWNPIESEYIILKNAISNTEKKFNK